MLRDTLGRSLEKDIRARSETLALEGLIKTMDEGTIVPNLAPCEPLDIQEVRDLVPVEAGTEGEIVVRKRAPGPSTQGKDRKKHPSRSWLFS